MSEIKARVKEDLTARQDRGMRRRKLLVDQMRLIQQKEVWHLKMHLNMLASVIHVHVYPSENLSGLHVMVWV